MADHAEENPHIKRRLLIGAAALTGIAGGIAVALSGGRQRAAQSEALEDLWALQAELPTGGTYPFAPLQGNPLLLNFWATWCPPCIEEMPLLNAFYQQNAAKGWQVVGLAADQAQAVERFLRQRPVQFPTPLAGLAAIELSRKLGNLSGALPFTVVIDSGGTIALRHMGKISAAQLASLEKLEKS